jgi:DNA-directed RNA polymerase specialized sigma24 family protein
MRTPGYAASYQLPGTRIDNCSCTKDVAIQGVDEAVRLLDLDRAIESLAVDSPFPAQVIEMRYFGGMTAEETAEAVGRSVHVVRHELRYAHAWLRRKLSSTLNSD